MDRQLRSIVIGALIGGALVVYAFLVAAWAKSSDGSVISKWDQPPQVAYHSYEPYEVEIFGDRADENSGEGSRVREIRIFTRGNDSYYSSYQFALEKDSAPVLWNTAGVQIPMAHGVKLFIPKESFIGGR
jgi:hypothetical protein